jgi:competence protein ComEC
MSFAAVVALIAGWEVMSARRRFDEAPTFWRRGLFRYLGGVALTTLIAGTATAPFALYHFNRYALYGLVANMIAVPATALWIMPWAVVAFLLMPFGLEGLALAPMGWGVDLVNAVAREVAAWPGAVALLPAMPTWGLALVAIGGLWLCLWRRRWRLIGLGAVAAGMLSIALVRPPDILVDAGGLIAVRGGDSTLAVSSLRAGRFTREVWLRQAGLEADALEAWPASGRSADGRLACDGLGCIVRAHGQTVSLVRDRAALIEDCWRATVVVGTIAFGRDPCRGRAKVIDGSDFRQGGAHALWLDADGVRIESVNDRRGRRPWVLRSDGPKRGDR